MNYDPNTTHWKVGDLVIHDADDKVARMLMRVVGFTEDGLCRSVYVDPERQRKWGPEKRSRILNRMAVLHDPKRFGIEGGGE